jgi:hypothetical protein
MVYSFANRGNPSPGYTLGAPCEAYIYREIEKRKSICGLLETVMKTVLVIRLITLPLSCQYPQVYAL